MSESHDVNGASEPDGGVPELPWSLAALAALAGGWFLLATGRGGPSSPILLLVVGLAASGVALGGRRFGPRTEGSLDLSARLGLGLLGGALGGLLVLAARWLLGTLGIPAALGVTMPAAGTAADLLRHVGAASMWGLVLGVLYPRLPGRGGATRGSMFSLLPTLYVLLKVYPLDRDGGLFGVELGALTFAFVVGLNLLWGAFTGATIGWGATCDEAPLARPLEEELPGRAG